jgi:hypothetical protein
VRRGVPDDSGRCGRAAARPAGADTDDPRLTQLIGELSLKSERFRRLWARHDVRRWEGVTTRLRHPRVGELHPRREKLAVTGSDGLLLVVHHAEPGTPSATALAVTNPYQGDIVG